MEVKQFETLVDEGFVEIHQECPLLFINGAEIILQIFEEGGFEVGGFDSVPMLPLPIAVSADAYIFHQAFAADKVAFVDGDREVELPIGRVDSAAVAEGLLEVVLMLFNENWFARLETYEPTDGGERGGRENHSVCGLLRSALLI